MVRPSSHHRRTVTAEPQVPGPGRNLPTPKNVATSVAQSAARGRDAPETAGGRRRSVGRVGGRHLRVPGSGSAGVSPAVGWASRPPTQTHRQFRKSSLLRILHDIAHRALELTLIAEKMIVILPLPKAAAQVQQLVRLLRAERFPGLNNFRQSMAGEHAQNRMHMVGHDAPGEKTVTLIIEVAQCIGNHVCDDWILQMARARAGVQILLDDFRRKARGFLFVRQRSIRGEAVSLS